MLRGLALLASVLLALPVSAQAPRKIGELQLSLVGLSARLDPANPAVPKNAAAGVRVVVAAGGRILDAAEVATFLDSGFEVQAELSGPGLSSTLTLPGPEAPANSDPLILPLPALVIAGDYALTNLRLVAGGRAVLDVAPGQTTLKVIDQILVTSVKTRALSLDEIRAKGIVLDSDDYLGFQFDLGMRVDSNAVQLSFPVVFDRTGVPLPAPLLPPPSPGRTGVDVPPMTIVPGLLRPPRLPGLPEAPEPRLPSGEPVRIASVLVIPGNVGYLKQFFSAKLFVANGAPVGSGLTVRGVTGSLALPAGDDRELGTADDPLALPETVRGAQPDTMPVRQVGPDGEPDTADDVAALRPGEQGQAEFLVRGEREGFHRLDFDIAATLDGLATGPVAVAGRATGGVLVRNPYFDVTFVVPSVVRAQEEFSLFATVTNIGQGAANLLTLALDEAALSGAALLHAPDPIDTLAPGDSRTVEFRLRSQRTGQVTATYLRFDTASGASGDLRFRLGVGERGVPLSPDTLVLPAAVAAVPDGVVAAAMRVLGQAWSAANAPVGLLPRGVIRPRREAVVQRALAVAEAGLRITLGQPEADALRDLAADLASGEPRDAGFDQIVAGTEAGAALGAAVRAELGSEVASAGGIVEYATAAAQVQASGPDFTSIAVAGPVTATWTNANGQPLGLALGTWFLGPPPAAPSRLTLQADDDGAVEIDVVGPRGDGRFVRARLALAVAAGGRGALRLDPSRPDHLELLWDAEGDGVFETRRVASLSVLASSGPRLVAAQVIGPETLSGASPFGTQAVLLFDRPVAAASASDASRYEIARNRVLGPRRQLSGRLVFLGLEQPEGRHVSARIAVDGLSDPRGAVGPSVGVDLGSRVSDPGAVVTGRVLEADGTPVPGALVILTEQTNLLCDSARHTGIAATTVDAEGRYQFRFVRQDNCGYPFGVSVRDPATGSLRRASSHVRGDGEAIALDLVLLGTGGVAGTVRDLTGAVVPGARVLVTSQTDPQVGRTTTADGDGRYAVSGITVGPVSVQAAKDAGLGHAAGVIARAGVTAAIDVTVDGGTVRARGRVRKLEDGVLAPAVGVAVWFQIAQADTLTTVGTATTDGAGTFALDALPTGAYLLRAFLNSRDVAQASGVAGAGDTIDVDLVIEVDRDEYATVRGQVRLPDGSPAAGALVQQAGTSFGALADAQGRYEIRGVLVRPTMSETFEATSADLARRGRASFTVAAPGLVEGVDIQLSGLGEAAFTVLAADGTPVTGQVVALLGWGCGVARQATTDAHGRVTFGGVALGSVRAAAVRSLPGFVDFASASASVTREGATGFGILRFGGAGVVTGSTVDGAGQPVAGAQVALTSRVYDASECGLVSRESHRATSDALGRFRFSAANAGPVTVVARHPWHPITTSARATLSAAGVELTLRLVDTTAGVLSGQVLRSDGVTSAPGGVEVGVEGPLPEVVVRTDSAGMFRFARVLPAGRYRLTARDPATGELAREEVYLRAGLDAEHDVVLQGTGTVRVRVVSGDDQPVQRAFVRLTETDYPNRVHERSLEPASEGEALFEGVYQGGLAVTVRDPLGRGGRAAATLGRAGDTLDVKVRLTTTGTVQGVFRMPSGEPIAYGNVRLSGPGGTLGQATTEGVGDVGAFRFENVPAGSFRLEAQDPLTARTGVAAGSLESEGEIVAVEIRAEGLGRVQGLVTSNGQVEPGARVTLASGRYQASTLADAAGLYEVEGVPEGRVTATASLGAGFLKGTAAATLVGDGAVLDLPVALRDSGRVVGRVVDADGVSDGASAQVSLWVGGSGGGGQSLATGAGSRFEFPQVAEGTATLTADVFGSVDRGRATAEVKGGETVDVELALNGTGVIEGVALDSGGVPTAGQLRIGGTGAFGWGYTLALPADGRFRLPEVLAGPFTARLAAPSGSVMLYGSVADAVAPGETKAIVLQVQPSAGVRGRVVRSDGTTPAYGALVEAVVAGGRKVDGQVQADGAFSVPGLPLGALSLTIRDPLTAGLAQVGGLALTANGATLDVGTVVLDHAAPTITILDPAPGAVRKALIGSITVAVSDAGAGLDPASIEVQYGGGSRQAFPAPVDGTASRSLDPGRLVIGSNRLIVHARDRAGNAGRAEVVFTISGSTLRGLLRHADGTPAAGLPVSVDGRPARVTDGAGRFEEPGLRPGAYGVTATDPVSGLSAHEPVSLLDGEDKDVTVTFPAYAHVSGVVVHGSGAPAAGVLLLATPAGSPNAAASATTDASGAYSLRNLPLGNWTIEARDGVDRGRGTPVLSTLGASYRLDLQLNGVGAVTVVVRSAAGVVVPGASVTLASSSPYASPRSGTTDASGRVRLEDVLAGALVASAHDPVTGLDGQATGGLADGGDVTLAVELEPIGRIAGVVRGALGGVVAGATVELSGPRSATAVSGSDGGFAFENVPLGTFTLEARTAAGDVGTASGTLTTPGQTATRDVTLTGFGNVSVLVLDAAGAPRPGALVTLDNPGTRRTATTPADGRVSFAAVRAGSVQARAEHDGLLVARNATLAAGQDLELTLTLQAVGNFAGRVLSSDGAAPIAGATVFLFKSGNVPSGSVTTGADGAYSFEGQTLGSYWLDVKIGSRVRARAGGLVLSTNGQQVERDVPLVPAGRVSGIVSLDGAPLANADVRLSAQNPQIPQSLSTRTAADGGYSFELVPVGAFVLTATASGGKWGTAAGTLVAEAEEVAVDVALLDSTVNLGATGFDDGNGFRWGLTAAGAVTNSTNSCLASGSTLRVVRDGVTTTFAGSGSLVATEESKREVVLRQNAAGLDLVRKVYIPADGYHQRALNLLTNPGPEPVTLDVVLEETASGTPAVAATSSGDASFGADDSHLRLSFGSCGQGLGIAFRGSGALAPTVASISAPAASRTLTLRWSQVTLAPGETRAFLVLRAPATGAARAQASIERLGALPPEALAGLAPDEAAAVANFVIPTDVASALAPLPLYATVAGRVYGGDGVTPLAGFNPTFTSSSPHYGRAWKGSNRTDATFNVSHTALAPEDVVPREPFTLSLTVNNAFGSHTATATGAFATDGVRDITRLPGASLRASDSAGTTAYLTDGDPDTGWGSRALPRWLEVAFAGPATVHELVFTAPGLVPGATASFGAGARLDFYDAGGGLISSRTEGPLSAPTRLVVPVEPPVAGVARVRVTDLAVEGDRTFGEFQVLGEAEGVSGRADVALVFRGTGVLAGVVRASDGSPVSGASVRVMRGTSGLPVATTGASGAFQFQPLPPGPYTLTVTLESGFAQVAEAIEIAADARLAHDVHFPPVATISGTVRTAAGVVQSVYVVLSRPGRELFIRSSAQTGAYAFTGVPDGTYQLRAIDGRSGAEVERQVVIADGQSRVEDFSLIAVGRVRATVKLNGAPLANARVYAFSSAPGADSSTCVTATTGICDVLDVAAGDVLVRAEYPGVAQSYATGDVVISSEGVTVPISLDVPGVGSVTGTLRARDGTVLPLGAFVNQLTLFNADGQSLTPAFGTNAAGVFTRSLVPIGVVRVQYRGFGWYSAETVGVIPAHGAAIALDGLVPNGAVRSGRQREIWELTLPAGKAAHVKAVGQAWGGLPALAGPVVEVFAPDGQPVGAAASGIAFTTAVAGRYTVIARSSSTSATGGYLIGSNANDQDLTYRLPTLPNVAGVVRRQGITSGVAGLAVRVVRDGVVIATATTDGGGGYVFPLFTTGPYAVEVLESGEVVARVADVAVEGPTQVHDLTVPALGTVRVVARQGAVPRAGLVVNLETDNAGAVGSQRARTVTTDAAGVASTSLAVGLVTARAVDPVTGAPVETAGSLAAGSMLELSLVLPDAGADLGGYVLDATGAPAAGRPVSLSQDGRVVDTATSDATGAFAFGFRMAGSYDLVAQAADGARARAQVVVTGQAPVAVELRFEPDSLEREVALPYDLTADPRFPFVVDRNGVVKPAPGSCDPFCSGFLVLGARLLHDLDDGTAVLTRGGRELILAPTDVDGLELRRRILVPEAGDWARVVFELRNNGSAAVTRFVALDDKHLSPGQPWQVATTSNGDTLFEGTDAFVALEQPSVPDSPAWAVVTQGPGPIPADASYQEQDGTGWHWYGSAWNAVTIPAGGRVMFALFLVQAGHGEASFVAARAAAVAGLQDAQALAGLDAGDRAALVNFVAPAVASLSGVARDATGVPLPGARVAVLDGAGHVLAETVANSSGGYRFVDLPPGSLRVVMEAAGQVGASPVTLAAGAASVADVGLYSDAERGTVRVRAAHALDATPASGQPAGLRSSCCGTFWRPVAVLDAAGEAVFAGVPAGTARVFVGHGGEGRASVEAVAGQEALAVVSWQPVVALPTDLDPLENGVDVVWEDMVVADAGYSCEPWCGPYVRLGTQWGPGSELRPARLRSGGRELDRVASGAVHGLVSSRRILRAPSGAWLRVLDVFENAGASDVAIEVTTEAWMSERVGGPAGEVLLSADGDASLGVGDDWGLIGTDGPTGPVVGFLVSAGSGARPTVLGFASWAESTWQGSEPLASWTLTIPAGGRRIVATWILQGARDDLAALQARAEALRQGTETDMLLGLSPADRQDLVNVRFP